MTTPISSKLSPPLLLRLTRLFATATTTSAATEIVTVPEPSSTPNSIPSKRGTIRDIKGNIDARQLKLSWLESLSCPLPENYKTRVSDESNCGYRDAGWVIGVDPDLTGALAVLKPDDSPQVFDSPHLKVLVGKRVRKRLDVKSIVQLLQSVDAPIGTTAYIEQSIPFPKDGKQGWWCGGFGYGLWIGILVASGYSVVPVASLLWKNEFKHARGRSSKDDSRELASSLFPSMSSLLKRKKDHGRAEALLIAAYGKGLKLKIDSPQILENLTP